MFELIVSESEKMAIDKMREDYAALETKYNELKSFKEQYDADLLKAEKDAIFASSEYDAIRESDGFKQLVEDAENYSVDELKVKADLLFAASMKNLESAGVLASNVQSVTIQQIYNDNRNEIPESIKELIGAVQKRDMCKSLDEEVIDI
jgi:hypothetical protein